MAKPRAMCSQFRRQRLYFRDKETEMHCMKLAPNKASISPDDVDIINTHGTGTIEAVFGEHPRVHINNIKSYIGHAMGAADALELAGNLLSFKDYIVHSTINLDHLDPECHLNNLVIKEPKGIDKIDCILNNSFGILSINSELVAKRFER